jgi:RNA polymerase sigma factor (TIGR02999 family)
VADAAHVAIQRLLDKLEQGDRAALDELFPLLYEQLSELAHRLRRRWHGDHTLNTTALIHESYLKLVGHKQLRAESRAHFLALAAKVMRHILINYARDRRAEKRGGDASLVRIDDTNLGTPPALTLSPEQADELVALNEALRGLEQVDERQSRIVECRFFGGMSVEETASAIGISERTVKRDWALAQDWLQQKMEQLRE